MVAAWLQRHRQPCMTPVALPCPVSGDATASTFVRCSNCCQPTKDARLRTPPRAGRTETNWSMLRTLPPVQMLEITQLASLRTSKSSLASMNMTRFNMSFSFICEAQQRCMREPAGRSELAPALPPQRVCARGSMHYSAVTIDDCHQDSATGRHTHTNKPTNQPNPHHLTHQLIDLHGRAGGDVG
jgi:hypothetical protein